MSKGRRPFFCPNSITLREDKLLDGLRAVCADVFSDIDAMVEAAIAEARQAVQDNRSEVVRVRAELGRMDKESLALAGLLVDPDVLAEPLAKRALIRKASDLEARRDTLQK